MKRHLLHAHFQDFSTVNHRSFFWGGALQYKDTLMGLRQSENQTISPSGPDPSQMEARRLPRLTLSYPAISGQPGGEPVKMASDSVVDPVWQLCY